MKYSYLWLKELSGTKKSPQQLAKLLTMHSFEFEEMKTEGKETQLVFDILANRGHDALSHIGMAREICALEGRSLKVTPTRGISKGNGKLSVEILDKRLCRRYIGAHIENIKVVPSLKWIQERLLASGVKPINNIVDITNYVMLETGQPLHAFDIAKLASRNAKPEIVVRRAKNGEKMALLDEKEYELYSSDLVIADKEKAIALAGVMGGFESGIAKNTSSIILESANFDPVSIRKTRSAHGISTESSYRFERDIDPNLAETAAVRAIELIMQYGGSNVKVLATSDVYPKKIKPWQIKLNTDYINNLLGENIPAKKISNILGSLGIKIKKSKKYSIAEIPTVRIDLKTQEDIIEEIGRIYGYENIPAKAPTIELSSPPVNEKRIFEDKLRDLMTGSGFSEMMNYSFYSKDDIEKCNLNLDEHFEVANPMNPDQQYIRTALVPNILKNIELNQKNFDKFSIFEIGQKYNKESGKVGEFTRFVGAMIDNSLKDDLFFALKGELEELLQKIGIRNSKFKIQNSTHKYWHPTRTVIIFSNGTKIGKIGEVSPQVLEKYGIKQRIVVFSFKMEALMKACETEKIYRPISKFPSVKRDISMYLPENVIYADIEKKISDAGGKIVKNIELFDIFEKEGEKSLALRIEIGSREKTLTSAEIDSVMKNIITKLEKDLKVRVRK